MQSGFARSPFAATIVAMCVTSTWLWPSIAATKQSSPADLPTRKYLDLAAIKIMVAGAEAEARKRNVEVSICVVDESGNLLFLEKADAASINSVQFAEKKARQAALYGSPSKDAADSVKNGSVAFLTFPDYFPVQGGLPIKVDGRTIGAIAASGAKSEIDEAIVQAGIDARFRK
jgi:glc operon protein GlcG